MRTVVYPVNTTFPSPRANTIQILNTANALAQAGHRVHLVARKGNTDEEGIFAYYGVERSANLHLHLVPAARWFKSAKAQESLIVKKTLHVLNRAGGKSTVVFTRDPLFARILLTLRGMLGFHLVYEAHTLFSETARETYMPIAWNDRKEKRIRKREQTVFAKADAIVFISSSLRAFVQERFPLTRPSIVVHDGTKIPESLPSSGQPGVLCYSGQFYWWKGMSTLMESMRWVEGGKLRMYGGGYSTVHDDMALMQKVIAEHGLQDRIEFCGLLPPARVPEALAQCSIGILPLPLNVIANRCNSPLKLFDYMANGLAVVSSDLLTIREIIRHGVNGHLVPPGDARALADGINLLLKNDAYRRSLAEDAFKTVAAYSWTERGRQLSDFLNRL